MACLGSFGGEIRPVKVNVNAVINGQLISHLTHRIEYSFCQNYSPITIPRDSRFYRAALTAADEEVDFIACVLPPGRSQRTEFVYEADDLGDRIVLTKKTTQTQGANARNANRQPQEPEDPVTRAVNRAQSYMDRMVALEFNARNANRTSQQPQARDPSPANSDLSQAEDPVERDVNRAMEYMRRAEQAEAEANARRASRTSQLSQPQPRTPPPRASRNRNAQEEEDPEETDDPVARDVNRAMEYMRLAEEAEANARRANRYSR